MLDNETRRELFERVGETGADRIDPTALPEGVEPHTIEPVLDGIWQAWVGLTFTMLSFGFTHRTLCDTAGQMIPVHNEARERAQTA